LAASRSRQQAGQQGVFVLKLRKNSSTKRAAKRSSTASLSVTSSLLLSLCHSALSLDGIFFADFARTG